MYLGLNYVNGDFCKHRPDFPKLNPSTGESVGLFPNSEPMEIMEAVAAAKEAQKKWRANEVTWTVNHGPLAFPQGLK